MQNKVVKSNEVPEKLYFAESDKGLLDIYSNREPDDDIEYTRIDIFIEKIKGFLNKKDDKDYYTIGYIKRHLEEIIKEIGL